jgi:hypothetical protein
VDFVGFLLHNTYNQVLRFSITRVCPCLIIWMQILFRINLLHNSLMNYLWCSMNVYFVQVYCCCGAAVFIYVSLCVLVHILKFQKYWHSILIHYWYSYFKKNYSKRSYWSIHLGYDFVTSFRMQLLEYILLLVIIFEEKQNGPRKARGFYLCLFHPLTVVEERWLIY